MLSFLNSIVLIKLAVCYAQHSLDTLIKNKSCASPVRYICAHKCAMHHTVWTRLFKIVVHPHPNINKMWIFNAMHLFTSILIWITIFESGNAAVSYVIFSYRFTVECWLIWPFAIQGFKVFQCELLSKWLKEYYE